jgi:hypothetical protein
VTYTDEERVLQKPIPWILRIVGETGVHKNWPLIATDSDLPGLQFLLDTGKRSIKYPDCPS